MEQLDKEMIEELSEPAKRVFRSLDYRSQRRMLKKAKEMGKQKRRKTQQKERVKKKSITKKQKKKEQAKERGSSTKRNQSRTASFVGTEIKDTSAQILQSMLLGTTMSEETYELSDCLTKAKSKSPNDIKGISLALQGYNFGKGSSGSYSQNYDVLGRELMLEYELRLLPDDECIIFVRGENPIRDKKWFPWEHEQYLEARKCGAFNPKEQQEKQQKPMEECEFLDEESLNYLKLQKDKNENIRLYELDAFSFMMMDLDAIEKKIHSTPNDKKGKAGEPTITAGMIQSALHAEKEREEAERKAWFVENFDSLTLLDIYASEWIGEIRRNVIRDLLQAEAPEEVIKSIIRPEIEEGQVLQKKKMWMEMEGK